LLTPKFPEGGTINSFRFPKTETDAGQNQPALAWCRLGERNIRYG
jgi:hypothetical protein